MKLSKYEVEEGNITILVPFTGVPATIRELLRRYCISYRPCRDGDRYTITAYRWREIIKTAREATNARDQ